MKFRYLMVAVTSILFSSCANEEVEGVMNRSDEPVAVKFELSSTEAELAETQKDFTWALLEAALAENNGNDVLLSPMCVQMALNMTANGMGEESLMQTLEVMGINDRNALNSLDKTLLEYLPKYDPKGAQVTMCFGNWQDKNARFVPGFAKTLESLFNVPTFSYDFKSEDMTTLVNNWAKKSTDGLIDKVITEEPDNSVAMYLCNSIYFKGVWKNQFKKDKTQLGDFKDSTGKVTGKAMMMEYPLEEDKDFFYTQFDGYRKASFSYGDGSFELNIFLPNAGVNITELCGLVKNYKSDLVSYKWKNYSCGKVLIPRFEVSSNDKINGLMKRLGIDLANSDYSGICLDPISIQMSQASYLSVDEEGTKAASVTVQEGWVSSSGHMPKGEDFVVDRPFVFTITGPYCTLFVGTMSNPDVK